MKTILYSLLFSFVSVFCVAQSPVNLKLHLEKGKTYSIKSKTTQVMEITTGGQLINMNVSTGTFFSFKVLKIQNEIMDLEFKFDTISTKSTSVMGTNETNSAKPGNLPIEKVLNKLSKYKIIAQVSTSGKFIGFTNFGLFRDSVLMIIDSIPATKRDDTRKQADIMLKESAIRSYIEPIFSYLPENAVKPGDKWESSYMTNANSVSILSANTYTLNSSDKKTANISGVSEVESIPSNDASAQMNMDIKGSSTSESTIDIATGLSLKSTAKSHFEGNMTVNNNGNKMEMPLKADGETESVLIK